MWVLLAFGSALFAGLTAILAKVGIRDTDTDVATAVRTVVVLLFSWLMAWLTGSVAGLSAVSARTWVFLVLSGLATGASWLCYFRALQMGDVNKVAPIDKSATVLTMLLAFIFLGEGLTWLKALCMALIGGGAYLMIRRKPLPAAQAGASAQAGEAENAPVAAPPRKWPAWLVYALGSAVFASLTAILGKVGIEGVDATLGTAIRTCVVLAMAWAIVLGRSKQQAVRRIHPVSMVFLVLSGFATGASWLCYYSALRLGPASVVVPIDKLSILVSIAFSRAVFGERLTRRAAIGLALLVLGTLLLLL
jgi:bacterial/archaeal transporter family protein